MKHSKPVFASFCGLVLVEEKRPKLVPACSFQSLQKPLFAPFIVNYHHVNPFCDQTVAAGIRNLQYQGLEMRALTKTTNRGASASLKPRQERWRTNDDGNKNEIVASKKRAQGQFLAYWINLGFNLPSMKRF